jgi:hypothetical protein
MDDHWLAVAIIGLLCLIWVYELISGRALIFGKWKIRNENSVGYWSTVIVEGVLLAVFLFLFSKTK